VEIDDMCLEIQNSLKYIRSIMHHKHFLTKVAS